MEDKFNILIKKILENEGGYVNNKNDSGGETNYGITKETAKNFGYFLSMKEIPIEVVYRIYRTLYYDKIQGDKINSFKITYNIFDMSVNAGTNRSIKILQEMLNEKYKYTLKIDGIIGKATLSILNLLSSKNEEQINKDYTDYRKKFYFSISKKNNNIIFLNGWINRVNKFY